MRRVREPRGLVFWEELDVREGGREAVLGMEEACDMETELVADGVWEIGDVVDVKLVVEGDLEAGEELRGESMLSLLMLGSSDGTGAVAKVTILMPLLVLVLAGMNRVVWLLAAGTLILCGWFALHPTVVSTVPVE